jgi:Galactose oxidase, central domain
VFGGGSGRIDPGAIAVISGQSVETSRLPASTTFHLTVSNGSTAATSDLTVDVHYRDRLRELAMPFARRGHVSVELQDGRILVIGGADESGGVTATTNYVFDPESETFSEFGALIDPRYFHTAVTLDSGDILVVGGAVSHASAPEAELIDGRTGVAMTTGAPTRNRLSATATLLEDGRVLLAAGSGLEGDLSQPPDATAELYDPTTGEFTLTAGTLNYARFGHSASRLPDGRVLIYGGSGNVSTLPPEIYDPETQHFTAVSSPEAIARTNHVVVALEDGRIGIFGGEDYRGTRLATNFRFDPTNGVFEPLVVLLGPRTMAQGAPLTDGRVLLAGGYTSTADEAASTEIVAPAGAWSTEGPQMSTGRVAHTVNRLRNGKVLIIGGAGGGAAALATAEIFE